MLIKIIKNVFLKRFKSFLFFFLVLSIGLFFYSYYYLNKPLEFVNQTVEIPFGSSFSTLSTELHQRGVISSPFIWKIYARLTGKSMSVQAGAYQLETGTSSFSLLDKLVKGDVIRHQITLVEGLNFAEVLQVLAADKRIEHQLDNLNHNEIMSLLGKIGEHPEGRFFPDSYQCTGGTTDLSILQRAYQRLNFILNDEWQKRDKDLPYKTPYDALIMASIIEKETGVAYERAEIAGVFVRRLQKGMRLQTDPTVIYGLGGSYKGNLRREHLKQLTLYNTYLFHGLPPTPIAMVGRESIQAALHPKAGKSLYFVAKGDGSHFFSDTLKQHNEAVSQYQVKQRAQQYQSAP